MKVRSAMSADVVTVRRDVGLKDVVEEMMLAHVSGLPVVDDDKGLAGIVTEADLVAKTAFAGTCSRAQSVVDVLSGRGHHWVDKATGWTAADDDVRSAARRMLEREVKRLPVVESGRLGCTVDGGRVTLTGDVRYEWDEFHHREPSPYRTAVPSPLGSFSRGSGRERRA